LSHGVRAQAHAEQRGGSGATDEVLAVHVVSSASSRRLSA
jgi:hypothetical protein